MKRIEAIINIPIIKGEYCFMAFLIDEILRKCISNAPKIGTEQ